MADFFPGSPERPDCSSCRLRLAGQWIESLYPSLPSTLVSAGRKPRMQRRPLPIHGRGAASNPPNRFERIHYEPGPDLDASDAPAPATPFYRDLSRSVQIVSKVVKFHSPVAWSPGPEHK